MLKMSDYNSFTVSDFSGGLNEHSKAHKVRSNQMQAADGVLMRTDGSVRSRKGTPHYQLQTFSTINTPAKSQFHYVKRNGQKQSLLYDGTNIWGDNNGGSYSKLQDSSGDLAITSNDGYCRFVQWKEIIIFGTNSSGLYVYDIENPTVFQPDLTGEDAAADGGDLIAEASDTSGFSLDDVHYVYRFSFDLFQGDTFIGESYPNHKKTGAYAGEVGGKDWDTAKREFWQATYDFTVITDDTNDNRSRFNKAGSFATITFPTGVKYINVYRRRSDVTLTLAKEKFEKNTDYFFIGAFTKLSFDTVAATEQVFLDDGGLPLGFQIRYEDFIKSPKPRHLSVHKNRLWLGNVIETREDGSEVLRPHRLYISLFNEPLAFGLLSWIEIDPTDGEGITGLISYKNKVLLVFKPHSVWIISGADESLDDDSPIISVEAISQDIGCVAPESIVIAEGKVVWLSHRGIYYYDGTRPKPLNTEMIDNKILERPNDKLEAPCAIFDQKEREYLIAHAHRDNNATYQTVLSIFSFKTGSWSRTILDTGVASFMQKQVTNEPNEILMGIEDTTTNMGNDTAVRRWRFGGGDGLSNTAISWSWKTAFFDGGEPFLDKEWQAVVVEVESVANITMKVSVDRHLVDETFTIKDTHADQDTATPNDLIWANDAGSLGGNWSDGTTVNSWIGDNNRPVLIHLKDKCKGKRIAFEFSGTNSSSQAEILSVTPLAKRVGDAAVMENRGEN